MPGIVEAEAETSTSRAVSRVSNWLANADLPPRFGGGVGGADLLRLSGDRSSAANWRWGYRLSCG